MLFDLRGRRRRAVQATYLMLAILMGGGLVLFGIGADVSGGLVDAFKGGGGGSSTDSALEDRVDSQEERLAKNPQNEAVLQEPDPRLLLARNEPARVARSDPDDAKDVCARPASTGSATRGRGRGRVQRPPATPSRCTTCRRSTAQRRRRRRSSRRTRTTWPHTFGWSRTRRSRATPTADLAAEKAVDLAPKAQRKQVEKQAEALKKPHSNSQRAADVPFRAANFHIEDEAVDDSTHVIELGGEVDLIRPGVQGAHGRADRVGQEADRGLSKATFIDSTTLGVLVGGVKRLRPAGGSLALVCTDENITKIFEITGLDRCSRSIPRAKRRWKRSAQAPLTNIVCSGR